MLRFYKRGPCIAMVMILIAGCCVIFVLRRTSKSFIIVNTSLNTSLTFGKRLRNAHITGSSRRLLSLVEEMSETSHLYENICRYAWVEDEEPSMKRFIRRPPSVACPPYKEEVFYRHKDGSFARLNKSTNCFALEIFGGLRESKSKERGEARRENVSFDLFYVNADVFQLICFDKFGRILMQKVYAGIRNKRYTQLINEGRPRRSPPKQFDKRMMSISIVGLDSTARAQFYRGMPKTVLQMQKMGFLTFHGYNKVGDNSAVNLLPILAEQIEEGLHFPLLDDEGDVNTARILPYNAKLDPDTFQFLWKKMQKKGCVTMFNDDPMHTSRGLFHYPTKSFEKGFRFSPTTHYYRAYYLEVYTALLNKPKVCLKGDFLYKNFLDIWYRFVSTHHNRCHFDFTFLTSVTHDVPNNIQWLDDVLSDRLRLLEESGALNNTFLIIMGDHGNRVSVMSRSFAGKIEERQPLLSIRPPPNFAAVYPRAFRNLRENTQRFTSNFDLHETLLDIIDNRLETDRPVKRGKSLFEPIPTNRSCVENNIVKNFCLCLISEPKNERSILNYTAMHISLSKYLKRFNCIEDNSLKCEKNIDFIDFPRQKGEIICGIRADVRVPNEMVRLSLRNKADLRGQKAKPSQFEYIYQNCSARSTTAEIIDITVQYRFDRRSNYSIIYPPMIKPGSGRCASRRNLFAYCRCLYKGEIKL